jgi:DNA-directed RNA polymerase subunit M/transcription elongation factor TFIIS
LEFYRKHNLPLPRKHPDIRHEERLKQRPSRELHLRKCDKCGKEMVSVYQKDPLLGGEGLGWGQTQEQKVYCEGCYQQEVYG